MNIEWNKVTWYSKFLAVVLGIAIFYGGYVFGNKFAELNKEPEVVAPVVSLSLEDGTYCFNRHQKATAKEPYEVSENIMLNVLGSEISGVKTGIQHGPDMSNGYEGTLSGVIKGNLIEVVYSYTVEGSRNKEFEIYTYEGKDVIKKRYPLVEEGDTLMPDETKEAKLIKYAGIECVNEAQL
jgi:hypothetical protein